MEAVLTLDRVSKRFGGVHALRDASIELRAGEVVCLVGENGAGKSTLSAIASGAVRPDSGEIRIGGRPVEFAAPGDAERQGICLAPQELNLCANLTVAENVMLGTFPRTSAGLLDRRAMLAEAERRLLRVGLAGLDLHARAEKLSVVEQAFVQLARALRDDARVLIADEPTAPMSAQEADRLLVLMEAVRAEGIAILYISHRLDEVLRLGTRCVVLRDGQVVDEFASDDGSRQRLVTSMIGDKALVEESAVAAPRDSETLLEVSGLEFGTGQDGVDLHVTAGEIVGVYGVAGSGREELGQTIFGSLPRTRGTVKIAGSPVAGRGIRSSIHAGVGYVPPERRSLGLLLDRSVVENLSLASLVPLRRRGLLSRQREQSRVREWMHRLSVKAADSRIAVGALSGGNQQKVLLGRWLLAGSRVLVLDDPTRGVDIGARGDIYRVLRELALAEQLAILIISSDIEEIATVCQRVYIMRKGAVVAELERPAQGEIARIAYDEEGDNRG